MQDGKLLPAAAAAKKRGVIFDVGHGGGSFDYTMAEPAIAQGAPPDTISSDIHVFSGNTPGMPFLTWVMSKFLNLGFTLEQVVAMATINPARVIGRLPKLGTLQVGAPGDVSILEVVEGPVRFVDTRKNERNGKVHLRPIQSRCRRGALRTAVQRALLRAVESISRILKPRGLGGARRRRECSHAADEGWFAARSSYRR